MSAYLNDPLHKHGLVIDQLTRGLALDEILQGIHITETKRFDVTENPLGGILLEESGIASLTGQRGRRGMDNLRVLLKGRLDSVACCALGRLFFFGGWRRGSRFANGRN